MQIYRRLVSKAGDQINRYCCCVENEVNLTRKGKEEYVGIQEYIGTHTKFQAFVKQRSSHFNVHEIDLDYKIVQLTDPTPPVEFPPNQPYYTHFTLYKDTYATPDIIKYMVQKLRVDISYVSMAGIKDKWGRTSQRMSIYNVEPQRLAALFEKDRRAKVGNFTYATNPLVPGDLTGNHFKILLLNVRNSSGSSSITKDVDVAVTSLKDFGFINYYGLQRFSFVHKNQIVGKAVLQMNWDKVFDLILSPSPYDCDLMSKAKQLWFSRRDPIEILKILSTNMGKQQHSDEYWLFKGLAEHYNEGKGDVMKAYKTIPKLLTQMWHSSFKSFLWNHLVSFRLHTFGHKPIPGDVVNLQTFTNKHSNDAFSDNSSISNEVFNNGIDTEPKNSHLMSHKVKVLTENDFDSNGNCRDYTIFDVLLDSPGSRMEKYVNPAIQNHFETLLRANGLEIDCFARYRETYCNKEDGHKRAFRHVMLKPQDVSYKIVPYDSMKNLDHLIPSDLDLLEKTQYQSAREGTILNLKFNNKKKTKTELANDNTNKICVIVEFSLPKSTYATMALRELLL